MEFDCGGAEHTELSFYAKRTTSYGVADLELWDGEVSRGIVPAIVDGFVRFVLAVPRGIHSYTFNAQSLHTQELAPPFVVDSFICRDVPEELGANMVVNFDDGFIPPEQEGWFVDNFGSQHQGDSAVHPPALEALDGVEMTFDCGGAEHTQLSFFARRTSSYGTAELAVFDGSESRGLVPAIVDGFTRFVLNVPQASHEYRFVARSMHTAWIPSPFVLDTFVCVNEDPALSPGSVVDFDDAFIPPEANGWLVDNFLGQHMGEAATHPPSLEPGDSASLDFSCPAGATQVTFQARRTSSYGTGDLVLFDGEEDRGVVPAIVDGFTPQTFEIGEPQALRLTATNSHTARMEPPFVVDTFTCE
jgi:hypothetical protein